MRIRNIFVASLLTMTFGCPGDDTGDTDANTTVNATDNTPGTTTEDPTVDPPGTTTGEPPAEGSTTTGEPPAEGSTTTGEPPAEDSTTAGAETTGGLACQDFCTTYFANCGADPANDYGDEASCATACADFDQKTFECKEYHAGMAAEDTIHCSHANLNGGGVCPAS